MDEKLNDDIYMCIKRVFCEKKSNTQKDIDSYKEGLDLRVALSLSFTMFALISL